MRPGPLLMSRLDVDLRVLDVPPVPVRDLESLIRLKLRSVYPGNPEETAFDFRFVRRARIRKAVVFVSRKPTVDAYRADAGRRSLVLPYQLVAQRVPRRGPFRAWFVRDTWAELLVYHDGILASSTVKRKARGRRFDLAGEEAKLPPESRTAPLLVVAPADDLERMARIEGAAYLSLESVHAGYHRPEGLFPAARRKVALSADVQVGMLAAAVIVLGLLVLFRQVRQAEDHCQRLGEIADALEQESRESRVLQQELDALRAERERLDALLPSDLYRLLSELSLVIGDAARIRGIGVRGDAFQVDATGSDPFRLMEELKTHGTFSELKLSQVVPDADSQHERFSISGVYHGR
jgi:hypothetical protein